MKLPETPHFEAERLKSVRDYNILDTLPEKEYDDLTFLASQICNTPVSLISILDENRQWFKSRHGTDLKETPRDISFCAHTILEASKSMIVTDVINDPRFIDNPLVLEDPNIRFYAGVSLQTPEGLRLGTICTLHTQPHKLTEDQIKGLNALASQVMALLELRRHKSALENNNSLLENKNRSLEEFAHVAAHDMKSPLSKITLITSIIEREFSGELDPELNELIGDISDSSKHLSHLISGVLKYHKNSELLDENKEEFKLNDLINDIFILVRQGQEGAVKLPDENRVIVAHKIALEQILLNIITNALKYNDKDQFLLKIDFKESSTHYHFTIEDNGPGIEKYDQRRIFKIFETASHKDRNGNKGSGIGLATVKKLVEGMGGVISLESEVGRGTKIDFSVRN